MKFSINRETITLAQHDRAKDMLVEFKGYFKNGTFTDLFCAAVAANSAQFDGINSVSMGRVIEMSECEITINRYEMTAWIKGIVTVNYNMIAEISFDGVQALHHDGESSVDAFIIVYKRIRD